MARSDDVPTRGGTRTSDHAEREHERERGEKRGSGAAWAALAILVMVGGFAFMLVSVNLNASGGAWSNPWLIWGVFAVLIAVAAAIGFVVTRKRAGREEFPARSMR